MPFSENSPILVLGGDGYLGWPLSLHLALEHPSRPVIMADNHLRRRLVKETGGESLLPILSPSGRIKAARDIHSVDNLEFIHLDVNSPVLEALIRERKPGTVYHLAQQCSAPYSMRGSREALFTLRNNEEGNMRVLWAVRRHVPEAHIVKLGTFGEYAKSGLDIAEGYFRPEYRGRIAERPVPYPREADDFYHASKINDSNYISVACRKWGLRVSDIMQSTVFGSWTEKTGAAHELFTRLDYDECFGTVVNRFLAQVVRGKSLSVYGTGHQRTGLMALSDSIQSLVSLCDKAPSVGTHRVINHVTEDSFSVIELAETMRGIAMEEGFLVTIERGAHDPRGETAPAKMEYRIERRYVSESFESAGMREVISKTFRMVLPYRHRVNAALFAPKTLWNGHSPVFEKSESSPHEFPDANFRLRHFPYGRINLNPGTLGSPSLDTLEAMGRFHEDERLGHPLGQYQHGREVLDRCLSLIPVLWKTNSHLATVSASATQFTNLLALSMARSFPNRSRPIRIVTTPHEHQGGISAFEALSDFEVLYLSALEMADNETFVDFLRKHRPDAGFYSHIAYDSGWRFPVESWASSMKAILPDSLVILDLCQSLGLLDPPFEYADVLFTSSHKWLFGPKGAGILWTNERFRRKIGALQWSGESLSFQPGESGFGPSGGMDFSIFSGLEATLRLHQFVGNKTIFARSSALSAYFRKNLRDILEHAGITHEFMDSPKGFPIASAVLSVDFVDLDPYPVYIHLEENGVHVKCIKGKQIAGATRNLLRFGFPYYEDEKRLDTVLACMEAYLSSCREPILAPNRHPHLAREN